PARDHQMKQQPEVSLYPEGDPLADAAQLANGTTLEICNRRFRRAQQKWARDPDPGETDRQCEAREPLCTPRYRAVPAFANSENSTYSSGRCEPALHLDKLLKRRQVIKTDDFKPGPD